MRMTERSSAEGADEYIKNKVFIPPFFLRNPVLQTVISSLKFRNKNKSSFDAVSAEKIIDAGNGIRLTGYYSGYGDDFTSPENSEINNKDSAKKKRGKLLILLHGWEGSEQSSYMVAAGRYFYKLGYSIFRLNMRDHGNSHHLNKGLFYGTLIDEAYTAVKQIVKNCGENKDIFIAGFSMGGNFALRIARLAGMDASSGLLLKKVIAVNPPLNPLTATANIDKYYIIKKYFLKKWKKSLSKKEAAFPDLYRFSELPVTDSCIELTDILVNKYSEYRDMPDYFSRYTLGKDFFSEIRIPVFIITSEDDPIIEISDFDVIRKAENPLIELSIEKYGGHCAYIKNMKLDTWLFDKILQKMR